MRRMRSPIAAGLSACAVILLLAGSCARNSSPPPVGSAVTPPPQTSAQPPLPEQLDFEGEKIGGGTIRGSDFAGHDVVLWLWAPW